MLEMDKVTQVQRLDAAVCFSHGASILGKGMNQNIFPPVMGKL